MSETYVLILTFMSVLIVSSIVVGLVSNRAEIARRFRQTQADDVVESPVISAEIRGLPMADAELVKNYYRVVQSDKEPNSLRNRLIRAGYFSASKVGIFQMVRMALAVGSFTLVMFGVARFFPAFPLSQVFFIGLFVSAFAFFISAVLLERRGDKREVHYRRIFPDFMDSLIVCVDAGLSIEAAMDRVSKEFLKSRDKDFGLHLAIMMLEVRGGRRLRDALSNFAKRLRIDEAQSLAVLFRQSEELGASVTKALRVFSEEMREKRMIRAEEKANALPLKMLFPLATFLFPISVLIVTVPIVMKVIQVLKSLAT
jgi:tight adherence protein C